MTPTLVLSNALGTSRQLWDAQVPALAPRVRVLQYEHGARSSVGELGADVLRMLDDADVERASFCGVSLGGAVGMWLAAHAPERIDRLVLACTSARFDGADSYRERAARVRVEGTAPFVDVTLDRWFTPRFRDRDRFRTMLLEAPRDAYAACCEAVAAWDFRERLGEIEAPTLVVAGAEDPATPPEHARTIAGGIPGSRLVVLDECAHLANVEQADRFNTVLLEELA
ncbi:MAG TPA: alpha/beta fold hydrolase [Gaiellaceae bacterium]|nr:alpha/beta fold hydrolase [Gaiellaceae bacterium]